MPERDQIRPGEGERFTPEEREPGVQSYDVAPPNMPPSPAGANAEIGGEAAASRRFAGTPADPELQPIERANRTADLPEPFLGYDGLPTGEIISWIDTEDPEPGLLRRIIEYEELKRDRATIIDECAQRIERWDRDD